MSYLNRLAAWLVLSLPLLAQAQPAASIADQASRWMRGQHVVLLGEVHDNAGGHAQRLALLEQALQSGWRPALVMEMFDREQQGELDAARLRCADDTDCIIALVGGKGWDWAQYRPLLVLAQRYQLPLVAGNLSRSDARKVMKEGYAAALTPGVRARYRLDQLLPADLAAGQQQAVDRGHCGMLPASAMPAMVRAQVARDVVLADALQAHAAQGAVLIAGNGHVRRDLGVPRWLPAKMPLWVVGFVEPGQGTAAYDLAVVVAETKREDPCLELKAMKRPQ
ncbi:ChaN family lipoprotein [Craterilacuibacter sp.]|uniref:ChaN family lipoprotein n=1 Tax=Craterilacuibacter sp. TaxID=2870909 RepID=UPI003F32585A